MRCLYRPRERPGLKSDSVLSMVFDVYQYVLANPDTLLGAQQNKQHGDLPRIVNLYLRRSLAASMCLCSSFSGVARSLRHAPTSGKHFEAALSALRDEVIARNPRNLYSQILNFGFAICRMSRSSCFLASFSAHMTRMTSPSSCTAGPR